MTTYFSFLQLDAFKQPAKLSSFNMLLSELDLLALQVYKVHQPEEKQLSW